MKLVKILSLLLSLQFTLEYNLALASRDTESNSVASLKQEAADLSALQASGLKQGAFYITTRDTLVRADNGDPELLVKGTIFTVLNDPTASSIQVGVDFSPIELTQSEYNISATDLKKSRPTINDESLFASVFEEEEAGELITAYEFGEIDSQVAQSTNPIVRQGQRRRGRIPGCYRDVKGWLLAHGLVSFRPPGGAAWQGYADLKAQGWTDIPYSQNMPIGSVCVSEGGKYDCGGKRCGHIAVQNGQGWYGAGLFPTPLLRGHYDLRCLVSPLSKRR